MTVKSGSSYPQTANSVEQHQQKSTSISGCVIRMGQITMGFGDLDTLYTILYKARDSAESRVTMPALSDYELSVIREFFETVESLR